MSDKAARKVEIKKQLRALLLSAPAALTITELKRDYYDFNGLEIPFRELGYTMLEDLFKDNEDAFIISWKNGVMCLQAVAQEATLHIQKLVSKQKVANKKWATLRKGGPSALRRSGPSGTAPRFSNSRGRGPPQHARQQPSVSAFIRKRLTQLLRAYPDGLPLTHFDTAFSRRFGVQLDFHRLGFSSMKELLLSVPDNVHLQDYKNGEWRVLAPQREKIPQSYDKPIKNDRPRDEDNWRERPDNKTRVNPVGFVAPHLHSTQETTHPKYQTQVSVSSNESDLQQHRQTAPRGRGRRRTGDTSEATSIGRESISSVESLEDDRMNIVKKNIRSILEEYPNGVWASQLPLLYRKSYGILDYKDYGFVSIIDMCGQLHDIITIERPDGKGDWLLFDARIPRAPQPKVKPKKEKAETNDVLKETIRQVLQQRPSGILLNDLPDVYQSLTGGQEIPWRKLGYQNFQLFIISLADRILNLEYKGDGQMLVYALDSGEPPKTNLLKLKPEPEPLPRKVPDIPADAIGARVFYRPQPLPPLNEDTEVNVSNVDSPGVFWIQLRGKETHRALDKVMNRLEALYCSAEGDCYRIPDYLMVLGQVVAAVFPEDSNWHRCVITSLSIGKYVEVYFVDFGNTCQVHRDQIRLLKSSFLKLPAQAIQARLSHLQPFDGKTWTLNARNRLLELVMNRPLFAIVTFEKDRVLSMLLLDTSTNVDICYNDLLVSEGYARFVPDTINTDFGLSQRQVPIYTHGEAFTCAGTPATRNLQPAASIPTQEQLCITIPIRRYVQPIQLTSEHIVNLINWQDTAYLPSAEVSGFFWEEDVITGMLQQYGGAAERVSLKLKDYPDLYEDLLQCELVKSGETKTITLYKLSSVPGILELFNHKSEELRSNVAELMQMFDPSDPYWKGEDYPESECSHNSTELAENSLDLEEIELNLRLFQFKRKRILKSMFTNPENHAQDVEEITQVENQISKLKQLQEMAQKGQVRNTALEPDSPVKPTAPTGLMPLSPSQGVPLPPLFSKSGDGAGHHSSSSSTPIKMNIVAPMQNPTATSKTTTSANQSQAMTATELANQEMLQKMAQVQQQFFQSMLLGPLSGQLSTNQTLPMSGHLSANQMMSMPVSNQSLPLHGQLPASQIMSVPGTNRTLPQTSQLPANQSLSNMFPSTSVGQSQLGMNQQTGVLNPQLMALMQGAMLPPFMPYLQGMGSDTGASSGMGLPAGTSSQVHLQDPSSPQQQSATLSSSMPLLPGLLPLLNSLNINQGSSATSDPKTSPNSDSAS